MGRLLGRRLKLSVTEHSSDLLLFSLVVREGNYSAAAQRLRLSRATVSRRVQRLERHLHARLFIRDTRQLSLTPAGVYLLQQTRELEREIQTIERKIQKFVSEPSGVIRCTTSTTLAIRLGQLIESEFLPHHPEITIEWEGNEKIANLIDEHYDLAIRVAYQIEDKRLIARQLVRVPIVLAATPKYLHASGPLTGIEDLGHHKCIALSSNSGSWLMKDENGRPVLLPITGTLRVGTNASLVEACLNHLGVIYIPRFCIESYLASQKLSTVLEDKPMPRKVFLVYAQRDLPVRVRLLIDYIVRIGKRHIVDLISSQAVVCTKPN